MRSRIALLNSVVVAAALFNGLLLQESQAQTTTHLFGSLTPSSDADVTFIGLFNQSPGYRIHQAKTIGDLDGNGFQELAFVARSHRRAYVLYTGPSHFQSGTFDLKNIVGFGGNDSLNGFEFHTDYQDAIGYNLDAIWPTRDVNNDGFDDFAVGQLSKECYLGDPTDPDDPRFSSGISCGHAYLVYGGNGTNSPPLLSGSVKASSEAPGARYYGPGDDWFTGNTGIGVGDLNSDGFADFAVASHAADVEGVGTPWPPFFCGGQTPCFQKPGYSEDTGAVHIVFGESSSSFLGTRNAYDIGDVDFATQQNSPGLSILGAAHDDAFGTSLAFGDVSGDGVPEVLIGAPQIWPPYTDHDGGKVYVFDGQALRSRLQGIQTAGRIKLGTLDDDLVYGVFRGAASNSQARRIIGDSVAALGDVNGDGIGDFAMNGESTASNANYLVLGQQGGFSGEIEVSSIGLIAPATVPGRAFTTSPGLAKPVISAAGDVNADGLADLLISQKRTTGNNDDKYYVLYGKPNIDAMVFNPLAPTNDRDGFVVSEILVGHQSLTAVGDVNGDGASDLMFTDGNQSTTGKSYLILGIPNHPGDLNGDCFVDLADKNIVNNSFGSNVTPGVWALGDPSGDGLVHIDDLNIVNNNLGFNCTPTPIPEPSAAVLLSLGVGGMMFRRHRRC